MEERRTTMGATTETDNMTTGEIADLAGVSEWMVRRCLSRGLLAEPKRVGPWRIWSAADLPAVRDALRRGGYLPADETKTAAG
jgi:hypothetical protein